MPAAPSTPLIDHPAAIPLFHGAEGPVHTTLFLSHAHALAAALPPGRHLVNLCRNRYAFAVALAAGLLRGRTALLNVDPALLSTLAETHPGTTVATDTPIDVPVPVTQVRSTGPATPSPSMSMSMSMSPCMSMSQANPEIDPAHLAALVFTSGSTGAPAPHPKRWGALVACSRAAAARFTGTSGGTIVGTVPPQHMYGLETTVLLPFHAPVASWCGPTFFPADVAAALHAAPAPRTLVTTPLQLRALLAANLPLPPIAAIISATAPLDPALALAAEHAWTTEVLEIFGATECGSIASRRTAAGPAWTPYPGTTLDITLTTATVHPADAPPVPLADLLQPGPGGTFELLGRRTDVVKLAGRRASLPGLNQLLIALPGVDDGAFVLPGPTEGTPDHHPSARLVAVVVAPGRTTASILAELRGRIDPVFMPRRVIRVNALPRNALGKLPRQALLQLVAEAG